MEQRIFNYRLSRARRTIENAFGILCARWRIFYTPIHAKAENFENFVLACLSLHNYLRLTDNVSYCPSGFTDSYDDTGNLQEGKWRTLAVGNEGMLPISRVKGSRYSNNAVEMRNSLRRFLNSEEGSVSWQEEYVTRTAYGKKMKSNFCFLYSIYIVLRYIYNIKFFSKISNAIIISFRSLFLHLVVH